MEKDLSDGKKASVPSREQMPWLRLLGVKLVKGLALSVDYPLYRTVTELVQPHACPRSSTNVDKTLALRSPVPPSQVPITQSLSSRAITALTYPSFYSLQMVGARPDLSLPLQSSDCVYPSLGHFHSMRQCPLQGCFFSRVVTYPLCECPSRFPFPDESLLCSQLSSCEIFEHASRPSLDDLCVPAVR